MIKEGNRVILIALVLIAVYFFILGTCINTSIDDDTNTEKLLDHLFNSGKISKQQYIYYIDKYTDGRKVKRTKLM